MGPKWTRWVELDKKWKEWTDVDQMEQSGPNGPNIPMQTKINRMDRNRLDGPECYVNVI